MAEPEIKGLIALQIQLGKKEGFEFEKKITRYNDIYDLYLLYLNVGNLKEEKQLREILFECVDYCIIGNSMHIPRKSLKETVEEYSWMTT